MKSALYQNSFLVLSFPRSGTNMVCDMLDQHPEILCHGELFNVSRIYYAFNFGELLYPDVPEARFLMSHGSMGFGSVAQRDSDPVGFFEKILAERFDKSCLGCVMFPSHAPDFQAALLTRPEVKKIILVRKNQLESYVSLLVAKEVGFYKVFKDAAEAFPEQAFKGQHVRVEVELEPFLEWGREQDLRLQELRELAEATGQHFFEITYESLIQPQGMSVKSELLRFLGVEPNPDFLVERTIKLKRKRLDEIIVNFVELEQFLRGTDKYWMLTNSDGS